MAAPASGTAATNTSGVRLRIALSGSISALNVAGVAWPVGAPVFTLESGESYTPTYSGTLTVVALGE